MKGDLREAIDERFAASFRRRSGTHNICYDVDAVERITQATEPLRLFGEDHIAGDDARLFDRAHVRMGQSREYEAGGSRVGG